MLLIGPTIGVKICQIGLEIKLIFWVINSFNGYMEQAQMFKSATQMIPLHSRLLCQYQLHLPQRLIISVPVEFTKESGTGQRAWGWLQQIGEMNEFCCSRRPFFSRKCGGETAVSVGGLQQIWVRNRFWRDGRIQPDHRAYTAAPIHAIVGERPFSCTMLWGTTANEGKKRIGCIDSLFTFIR